MTGRRRLAAAAALTACLAGGCSLGNKSKSGFDRDPLVQSHLLHGKRGGRNAGLAGGSDGRNDSVLQSASSTSNKPTTAYKPEADEYADQLPGRLPGESARPGRDPDYRWIVGRIHRRPERDASLYVKYGEPTGSADKSDKGEIRLAFNPRLAMLRDGDAVRLEGELQKGAAEPAYQVTSFTILHP